MSCVHTAWLAGLAPPTFQLTTRTWPTSCCMIHTELMLFGMFLGKSFTLTMIYLLFHLFWTMLCSINCLAFQTDFDRQHCGTNQQEDLQCALHLLIHMSGFQICSEKRKSSIVTRSLWLIFTHSGWFTILFLDEAVEWTLSCSTLWLRWLPFTQVMTAIRTMLTTAIIIRIITTGTTVAMMVTVFPVEGSGRWEGNELVECIWVPDAMIGGERMKLPVSNYEISKIESA